jgi:hypothetical protein
MGYRFYCCMILMNLCLLGWNETFYGDISNHYGDNNEIIMVFFTNHRQWGASKPFCWGHRSGYSTYLLGDIRRYLNGPWNELLTVVVCKWMICNRNPHFKMQTNDSWKYGDASEYHPEKSVSISLGAYFAGTCLSRLGIWIWFVTGRNSTTV